MALRFRDKIFVMTIPMVLFVIFIVVASYHYINRKVQTQQIADTSSVLSKNLNKICLPFVSTRNYMFLSSALESIAGTDSNILYVIFQDKEDKVVAKNKDAKEFYKEKATKVDIIYDSDIYTIKKYMCPGFESWITEAQVPIVKGLDRLGVLKIGYSSMGLASSSKDVIKIGIFASVMGLLVALGASFLISLILTKPIKQFINDIRIISDGDLDHKVNINSKDEIGRMASEFNQLTSKLANSIEGEIKIRKFFERYVPKKVVAEVLKQADGELFAGEKRNVSIFSLDIRKFTPFSERHQPEEVVVVLNKFFTEVSKIVIEREGNVDKFMGDGLMAVFGVPVAFDDHALCAVSAALDVKKVLGEFNSWLMEKMGETINIGIGINSGDVIAGNVGSTEKMEYTVIGSPVNIAFRVQELTKEKPDSILISEQTYNAVKDKVKVASFRKINLRGTTGDTEIFELLDMQS
ncbi:MAG: adenylate/guanylate cyclase domain-containing protein [Candidatus Anammoxibacter sp.]